MSPPSGALSLWMSKCTWGRCMVLKAGDSLGARQRANKAQVDPKALKRGLEQCW